MIENQVISLELAKKLKELGIKQESIFVWEYYDEQCHGVKYIPYAVVPDSFNKFQLYSAFTVAELGEIIFQLNHEYLEQMGYLEFTTEKVYRAVGDFYRITNNLSENIIDDLNEANARAMLLIYLFENKFHDKS